MEVNITLAIFANDLHFKRNKIMDIIKKTEFSKEEYDVFMYLVDTIIRNYVFKPKLGYFVEPNNRSIVITPREFAILQEFKRKHTIISFDSVLDEYISDKIKSELNEFLLELYAERKRAQSNR